MVFCKLTELDESRSGIIRSIENEGYSLKLLEMGIIPGEKVTMDINKKKGSPLKIHIGGAFISLRWEEADCIVVEC
jgi:ferrous iron transport protein A